MIKLYNFDELRPEEILNRDIRAEKNVEDVVDGIIADVRARGDGALKDYALKFDGAAIENLQVTQEEIDEAFANMDPYFLETLREAAANIEAFHRQQVHKNFVMNDKPGVVLGQKYTPIEKAGVYVPGGTAAYPSTVLMDVIPAKVAGVAEIVMTTPAGKDGNVNPVILAAAATAGSSCTSGSSALHCFLFIPSSPDTEKQGRLLKATLLFGCSVFLPDQAAFRFCTASVRWVTCSSAAALYRVSRLSSSTLSASSVSRSA